MKLLVIFSIAFIYGGIGSANNMNEIDAFCRDKQDYTNCARDYEGLPKLEKLPNINRQNPIEIMVVPYKKFSRIKNFKVKEKNCRSQLCLEE